MLKAIRYPDIWKFSNECPSPKDIPTWVDAKDKICEFTTAFLTPQFFKKLIFWLYPEYAGAGYFIEKGSDFHVIDYLYEAEEVRYGIENLSLKGHLCVLFVPINSGAFTERILSTGHYGEPKQVVIGDQSKNDPLDWEHGQSLDLFNSSLFSNCNRIFTFSHDAEFLYEIFVESE